VPPQSSLPPVIEAPTTGQGIAVIAMLLCWVLAVVVALWGSMREARRHDDDRRRELTADPAPGPTPGLSGFLDRWALWSLVFLGLGLGLLALGANLSRP